MCKQSACMTDQVTDTKSGTQSDVLTDCVQIALLVYNLTIGQMCWSGVHWPEWSVLLSNFRPVMLSVKQSVNSLSFSICDLIGHTC